MKSAYELIQDKQTGKENTPEELKILVNGFTAGDIPAYQMSAWLMAVYFQGMTPGETLAYTRVMLESGRRMDFSYLDGFAVDKHSTGGVGDKVSLILGPLLAACGCYVPMISGRGLGHTGGTLDKLDSIPGYRTGIELDEFKKIVETVGISMIGQTDDICPADRAVYALRDVTSTVASLPLISGSIMSKKIAEGISGLVLDIKCGNGAFMRTEEEAELLARLLLKVGQDYGLKVSFSVTDMNQPLGNAAGIWCEVRESIDILKNQAPADILEVILTLGEQALVLAGQEGNLRKKLSRALQDGSAYEKFQQMVSAQGGAAASLENPATNTPQYETVITAPVEGYFYQIDTLQAGLAVIALGGGRKIQSDTPDPTAGFILLHKIGDTLKAGEPLVKLFCSNSRKLEEGKLILSRAVTIDTKPPDARKLIYGTYP